MPEYVHSIESDLNVANRSPPSRHYPRANSCGVTFFYITLGFALSHSGVSPDHSRLLLASRPGSPLIVSTSTWTCSQVEFLRRRPFGDAWPISLPYFTALHTLPHTFVSAGGTSALGASYFLKKRANLVCFKISGTSAVGPPPWGTAIAACGKLPATNCRACRGALSLLSIGTAQTSGLRRDAGVHILPHT